LLSDHVFHLFGRAITITSQMQFIAIAVLAAIAAVWIVQQFRRRRVVVVQRSLVSDQLLYELSRIADSLDRIANRPADQAIAAVNAKAEQNRTIPYAILERERPHS
jgi:hypothetical protein